MYRAAGSAQEPPGRTASGYTHIFKNTALQAAQAVTETRLDATRHNYPIPPLATDDRNCITHQIADEQPARLNSPFSTKNGVPKGIRTPVTTVKGSCPRPLDDGDPVSDRINGGASRGRTDDLLHAMQALYQLSYSPTRRPGH